MVAIPNAVSENMTLPLSLFLFQLAVVLFAAKAGGEVCERYLKQPPVLGELAMGMLIGPHALGRIPIPGVGPLFPLAATGIGQVSLSPVSGEIYALAQIAIIVLLFSAGLGTDFREFVRSAGPASLVALGGMAFSFFFGASATVLFGLADNLASPQALLVGAMIGATSVSVAARILRDLGKLGTPEGVTILAADVIDDVMGILVLTVVLGLTTAGGLDTSQVLLSVARALGFWLLLVAVCIVAARGISRFIISFRAAGAALALALSLAFLGGGLAEEFGLATIIGAYAVGLALSNTELATILAKPIDTVHHIFVPIFFVVMGMLVDFRAVGGVVIFGLAISALAVLGKLLGCGLPALAIGFNRTGAMRIGFGMVPRAEVSLIIAGVALTRGLIEPGIFGVAVMLIMVSTVLTAVVLAALFKNDREGKHVQD